MTGSVQMNTSKIVYLSGRRQERSVISRRLLSAIIYKGVQDAIHQYSFIYMIVISGR